MVGVGQAWIETVAVLVGPVWIESVLAGAGPAGTVAVWVGTEMVWAVTGMAALNIEKPCYFKFTNIFSLISSKFQIRGKQYFVISLI